jgi:hypothetical protein
MPYKVELDCSTCEFLVEGICTNHKGIHGRGWRPEMTVRDKTCWSMSIDYFMNIVTQLPEYEQQLIRHNENITVEDLIHRLQAGYWKPQLLKKAKANATLTEPEIYFNLHSYI